MATLDVNVSASIDPNAKSTGGNGMADAGKLLEFNGDGGAEFGDSVAGPHVEIASAGLPVVNVESTGSEPCINAVNASTGSAIQGQAVGGHALTVLNTSTTNESVHAINNDPTKVGDIAKFGNADDLGVNIKNDGGLEWTSATGAGTTRTNLGLGDLALQRDGDKGDITVSNSGATWKIDPNAVGTTEIADNAVTYAKLQDMPANHLIGRHTAGSGDPQEINIDGGLELNGSNIRRSALTGDVTASAGSNSTTIANDAVTNGKLANMAQATIKGRQAGSGTGDPEDLTATQARTALGLGTAALVDTGTGSGDVPTITQADARYIQQSLMDAKGDIISASADNTPVRVGVGVNGSVLTADSGAAEGVSWGYQRGIHVPLVPSSGVYCIASVNGVALTTVTGAAGRLSLYPFIPCETFSVDRLDIEVTTNVAASNCKLAIYASSGSVPSALIVGTGDISTAANGVFGQAITSTQLVAGTVYWLAIHYSSNQAVRAIPVGGCYGFQYPGAGGTAQSTVRNVTSAYGSGLPDPPLGTTPTSVQIPAIMLRVA